MSVEFKGLVPVEGVFRLFTDTGVFLSVQNRDVFLDYQYMPPLLPNFVRGDTVTLLVSRDYTLRKGLVA